MIGACHALSVFYDLCNLIPPFFPMLLQYDQDVLSTGSDVTLYCVRECAQGSMRVQQVHVLFSCTLLIIKRHRFSDSYFKQEFSFKFYGQKPKNVISVVFEIEFETELAFRTSVISWLCGGCLFCFVLLSLFFTSNR